MKGTGIFFFNAFPPANILWYHKIRNVQQNFWSNQRNNKAGKLFYFNIRSFLCSLMEISNFSFCANDYRGLFSNPTLEEIKLQWKS